MSLSRRALQHQQHQRQQQHWPCATAGGSAMLTACARCLSVLSLRRAICTKRGAARSVGGIADSKCSIRPLLSILSALLPQHHSPSLLLSTPLGDHLGDSYLSSLLSSAAPPRLDGPNGRGRQRCGLARCAPEHPPGRSCPAHALPLGHAHLGRSRAGAGGTRKGSGAGRAGIGIGDGGWAPRAART